MDLLFFDIGVYNSAIIIHATLKNHVTRVTRVCFYHLRQLCLTRRSMSVRLFTLFTASCLNKKFATLFAGQRFDWIAWKVAICSLSGGYAFDCDPISRMPFMVNYTVRTLSKASNTSLTISLRLAVSCNSARNMLHTGACANAALLSIYLLTYKLCIRMYAATFFVSMVSTKTMHTRGIYVGERSFQLESHPRHLRNQ